MTDLTMYRGDTGRWPFAVAEDGSATNLTGGSLVFTVKRAYTDSGYVIRRTIGDGITVTSASGGSIVVSLPPSATADLPPYPSQFVWDLQLTEADGDVWTVARGNLFVEPDVTT